MRNRTQEIRYQELIRDIKNHAHKDELIQLMYQQIQEDSNKVYN